MTPDEFIKLVADTHYPGVLESATYEFCEKIHKAKHGFRKYRNYATFKEMRSRRKRRQAKKGLI